MTNNEEFELIEPTIQTDLLKAVHNNDIPEIRDLIGKCPSALDYIYPDYSQPIFLIACSQKDGRAETVRNLLKLGADCNDYRSYDDWEAIHFAAYNTNYEILKVLLEHKPECVNALEKYGNNALHILIRHGDVQSKDFLKCIELLLKNWINIGQIDTIKFQTPMDLISNYIDGDVQEVIRNMIQKLGVTYKQDLKELVQYVNERNQEKCIEEIDRCLERDNTLTDKCFPIGSTTLLQMCCRKRLCDVIKHLLSKNMDPTKTPGKDKDQPVMIAAANGHWDVLEILLEKHDVSKVPIQILTKILEFIDSENKDYRKCFNVFISAMKSANSDNHQLVRAKINTKDECENTSLHYAVWFADSEVIEELLSLGAYPGASNSYGTPMNDMKAETWKNHLDKCISEDPFINIYKEDFRVTFNFESLLSPNQEDIVNANRDCETGSFSEVKEPIPETEVVFSMATLPHMREHLTHPVIASFLTLKWQKYQWLFMTNLLFYIIFASAFLGYMLSDYWNMRNSICLPVSCSILVVTLFVLIIREIFQMYMNRTNYFKYLDNYIELVLIGITFRILSINISRTEKQQLWAISIIILSLELIMMLGKHPYFSTKVVMFKTVSYNFFAALFSYSLIIVAFTFSFYLLFNSSMERNNDDENDSTKENKTSPFNNLARSFFKTIVMLTGEFDTSGIDFDTFAMTSKVIFGLFIFMIHLILLNLLNGLAVSDTKEIRDQAKILANIARIKYIRSVENTLKHFVVLDNLINRFKKLFGCVVYEKGLLECEFYPNRNEFTFSSSQSDQNCSRYVSLGLDEETRKMVLIIILNRPRKNA